MNSISEPIFLKSEFYAATAQFLRRSLIKKVNELNEHIIRTCFCQNLWEKLQADFVLLSEPVFILSSKQRPHAKTEFVPTAAVPYNRRSKVSTVGGRKCVRSAAEKRVRQLRPAGASMFVTLATGREAPHRASDYVWRRPVRETFTCLSNRSLFIVGRQAAGRLSLQLERRHWTRTTLPCTRQQQWVTCRPQNARVDDTCQLSRTCLPVDCAP